MEPITSNEGLWLFAMTTACVAGNPVAPFRSGRWTSATYSGFLSCRLASGSVGFAWPPASRRNKNPALIQVGGFCNPLDPFSPVLGCAYRSHICVRNLAFSNWSAHWRNPDAYILAPYVQRFFVKRPAGQHPARRRHVLPLLRNATVDSFFKMYLSKLWSCQVLSRNLRCVCFLQCFPNRYSLVFFPRALGVSPKIRH